MAEPTRITLLERMRQSTSGKSWDEFVHVYDQLIAGWLMRRGVQAADADDIRQEVMTTVYQEIGQFEHSGRQGAFRNWLRNITSNRLKRLWSAKGRTVRAEEVDLSELANQLADDNSRMSLSWEAEHNRYLVEHLLGELKDRFADTSLSAFRRIVLEEESPREVAESLGMTLGAARVAQHRVLQALKVLGQGLID